MRTKFKPWGLPYLTSHLDIASQTFNKEDNFFNKGMELEIGGGKGDFIISLAKDNPNKHYLMIEKVTSVICVAAKKIVTEEIKNIKLIYNDFLRISNEIEENFFSKIYLNFSDPWPKKRHAKRRLTSKIYLDEYFRLLDKEGLLIIKTDQISLYNYTKENIDNNKFIIIYDNSDYIELEEGDYLTEYESKFRSKLKTIYRLKLKKVWKS